MPERAFEIFEKERALTGETPTTRAKLAHVLAAANRRLEAAKVLNELIANRQAAYVTPYEIAVVYSLLDEPDKGLEWLEKARGEHAVGFSIARVDPHLDNLRKHARFSDVVKNID